MVDVEEWYRRYGPMVLRRCRRLLRDDTLAMDAMQDVFVAVLRSGHRLRDEQPASLLLRISTNVCLNRLRTKRRHPEDADDELVQAIADAEEPGERSVARMLLATLFGTERESTRTIAVMHLVDGLKHEEIAREVGLSVSGVRRRLRVLRERLVALDPEPVPEGA